MKRVVVYISVFGGYDKLIPQINLPGIDFVCFTDTNITSETWEVRNVKPPYENDHTRNSRHFKIMPHLYLKEYDYSIYIDGNFLILDSLENVIELVFNHTKMAAFSHTPPYSNQENCIYKEFDRVLEFVENGVALDTLEALNRHKKFLKKTIYPKQNGLVATGVLFRNHNDAKVIETMELWWEMVNTYSKRDQLSFNYAVWETGLNFSYLPGEVREDNPWFYRLGGHKQQLWFRLLKYKLRKSIGIIQHPVETEKWLTLVNNSEKFESK